MKTVYTFKSLGLVRFFNVFEVSLSCSPRLHLCDKNIVGTTGLKAHLKKNVLFTAPKMYNCRKKYTYVLKMNGATNLCENKSFKLFILFKNHINVHTGVKTNQHEVKETRY